MQNSGGTILFFGEDEPYFEFSNFYVSEFIADFLLWRSVEHYFQAMKFDGNKYANYREQIRYASTPKIAKKLGNSRAYPLREDWTLVKEEVMRKALRRKFARPRLRKFLLTSGKKNLIENSPSDKYWGIGKNGDGKNRMGILLMQVRAEFREKSGK